MRTTRLAVTLALSLLATAVLSGCATATKPPKLVRGDFPSKYKTDRGANLYIGHNYVDHGGLTFYPDHLDVCWVADGFNFNGYDVLYIEPTKSTSNVETNKFWVLAELESQVPEQTGIWLGNKKIFGTIVTDPSKIKPGARVLKLKTTIVEFGGGHPHQALKVALGAFVIVAVVGVVVVAIVASRGGGGFGGGIHLPGWGSSSGQPSPWAKYRIWGKMMDGEKPMFEFQISRSGELSRTLESMMLDLTDFVAAVAGKYRLR